MPSDIRAQGYADFLAWLALALGLLLAVTGMLTDARTDLPAGVAARVNDRDIRMQDWTLAIAAANDARREPVSAATEQKILQTLVDEELLLQFAEDLGLSSQIPTIRNGLTQAAMDALAGIPNTEPERAELLRFYQSHTGLFSQPELRRISAWRHSHIDEARQGVNGQQIEMPAGLLSQRQVARWLGASLSQAVFEPTTTGRLENPVAVGQGWYVARIEQIQPGQLPAFSQIDQQLLQRHWQRQQREQQLAQALQSLRQQADIQIANGVAP